VIVPLIGVLLIVARSCDRPAPSHSVEHLPSMEVLFSPRGGCTDAVVREIENAQTNVFVQAYSFTSAPIAKALADARSRGVEVAVILDDSQKTEKYSSADFLHNAGIATGIDGRHAIAHNKVMILDGRTVITGSFNFTKAAEESNAENLLIIRDATIAQMYAQNWRSHAEHSQPYEGRQGTEGLQSGVGRPFQAVSGDGPDEKKEGAEQGRPPAKKPASKKTQKKTLPLSP
jgi:phosphatidylserine/phosphatidylglycerophosphate/cardiolipin synthase-like enzyme